MFVAKKNYRIPYSLDVTRLQAPVILTGPKGQGPFKRPIKLLTIMLIALLGLVVPMFVFLNTGISEGSFLGKLLLFLGWEIFVLTLVIPQGNGEEGYKMFWPTIGYWVDTHNKVISTRGDADVAEVSDILQIRKIDDSGRIAFANGWVGRIYEVDGHASNMLFENEKEYVIDSFERWLSLLPPNVNISIPTQHASIDVGDQMSAASERTGRQRTTDLRALAARREKILRDNIAGNSRFKTISQCVVISATDPTALDEQCQWFEQQVQNGMAKTAKRADFNHTLKLLRGTFAP